MTLTKKKSRIAIVHWAKPATLPQTWNRMMRMVKRFMTTTNNNDDDEEEEDDDNDDDEDVDEEEDDEA